MKPTDAQNPQESGGRIGLWTRLLVIDREKRREENARASSIESRPHPEPPELRPYANGWRSHRIMACRTTTIGTGNGSKRPLRGGRLDEEEEEKEEYQYRRLLADPHQVLH